MGWLDGTQNLDPPGLPSSVFAVTERRLAVRREVARGSRRSTTQRFRPVWEGFLPYCRVAARVRPSALLLLPMRITVSWFGSLRPANARTLVAPSRHRLGDSRWPWKHKRRASVKFYDRDYLDVSNPSIAASWPAYWPKMRGTGKRYDQEMGGNHDHRF